MLLARADHEACDALIEAVRELVVLHQSDTITAACALGAVLSDIACQMADGQPYEELGAMAHDGVAALVSSMIEAGPTIYADR